MQKTLLYEFTFPTLRIGRQFGQLELPVGLCGYIPIIQCRRSSDHSIERPGVGRDTACGRNIRSVTVSRSKSGQAVAKAIRSKSYDVIKCRSSQCRQTSARRHAELSERWPRKASIRLGDGDRVFVGQREETFYIDLGAAFDSLNSAPNTANP